MCNQSIAEENLLPRAYMYSILFMLAMPATIFSGLGLSVWLKVRKYNAQHTAAQAAESPEGQPDPAEADAPLSEHGPRGGG